MPCFPPLEAGHTFPPLAEGQSGRMGRRCNSRLTLQYPLICHGLSARVPRDSPEERSYTEILANSETPKVNQLVNL